MEISRKVQQVFKMAENLRKTRFYVFCTFTPLYWCFRLSRVPQREELFEIYRLVSKILHFMPCGPLSKILHFMPDSYKFLRIMKNAFFLILVCPKSPKWRFWHTKIAILVILACQNRHYGDVGMPKSPFWRF